MSPGREVSQCREVDLLPMWTRSAAAASAEVAAVARVETMEMVMAREMIMGTVLLDPLDNIAPVVAKVAVAVAAVVDVEEGLVDSADPPAAMVQGRVEKAMRTRRIRRKAAKKRPKVIDRHDAEVEEEVADEDVGKANRKVLKAARVVRGRKAKERNRRRFEHSVLTI
jgi:hypothetical protein